MLVVVLLLLVLLVLWSSVDPPSAASLDSPAVEEEGVGVLLRSPRLSWSSRFHAGSGGFCFFFFFFFFLFLWSAVVVVGTVVAVVAVGVVVVVVVVVVVDGAGAEVSAAMELVASTGRVTDGEVSNRLLSVVPVVSSCSLNRCGVREQSSGKER